MSGTERKGLQDVLEAVDPKCDVCQEPAAYGDLEGGVIYWTCDDPAHTLCQRGESCEVWVPANDPA